MWGKPSILRNRQTPHDFPADTEIEHLLKFWLAKSTSRSNTDAPLPISEYVYWSGY